MASGKRIGLVAVVVLAVAIIGFYLWQSSDQAQEPSLSIEPDAALPEPTPPGAVSQSDPSMTASPAASSTTTDAAAASTSAAPVDLSIDVNTLLDRTAPAAPASGTAAAPTSPATTQLKPLSPAELGALASSTAPGGATSTTPSSTTFGISQPSGTTGSATTSGGTYIVRQGDSMWSIAQRTLGNGSRWPQIARANPNVNPDSLQPGDRLIIPGTQPSTATPSSLGAGSPTTVASASPTSAANTRTVIVAEGETLWAIAQREYGDGTLWQVIFEANQDRMRNPNDLRSGERIRIPSLSR